MSLYAWTQDLPIDAEAYADITVRMAGAAMPGLVVHIAVEQDDGLMRYIDVWESEATCNAALATVVHPAVQPVLTERNVRVQGEPPRAPLRVAEVRFADGTTRS